ncbi:hypothetical protein HN587_04815 [Candidatus Woesearchaeota archaeon]|jgi:tRNA-dihydrouridine synthase B|nr:hypothetical protein [Candidatus Woesearchaeota archaeon]
MDKKIYFKLGKHNITSPVVLAPMLGVNCSSFRLMCAEYGAGLVYTGMIDCEEFVKLSNSDKKKKLNILKNEQPISAQIIGSGGENVVETVKFLDSLPEISAIDLNFSCPMPEFLSRKMGAFFLKHPEQIGKMINSVMDNTNKPISAKIRLGWDKHAINCVDVSKILKDFGVCGVAIHGKTRREVYSGSANWDPIKTVKKEVGCDSSDSSEEFFVIGNGDICKPGHVKYYLEREYCDAVMIGREAKGNPFLFRRCVELMHKGQNVSEPSFKQKKDLFLDFLDKYKKYETKIRLSEVKDHASWFLKGFGKKRYLMDRVDRAKTFNDILDIAQDC